MKCIVQIDKRPAWSSDSSIFQTDSCCCSALPRTLGLRPVETLSHSVWAITVSMEWSPDLRWGPGRLYLIEESHLEGLRMVRSWALFRYNNPSHQEAPPKELLLISTYRRMLYLEYTKPSIAFTKCHGWPLEIGTSFANHVKMCRISARAACTHRNHLHTVWES